MQNRLKQTEGGCGHSRRAAGSRKLHKRLISALQSRKNRIKKARWTEPGTESVKVVHAPLPMHPPKGLPDQFRWYVREIQQDTCADPYRRRQARIILRAACFLLYTRR